jgi:nitroimidazol reductase NimA-like FMN-containing flavoprotein (pyridoxamine 5'-phosphate oxidase superfamily)
MSQNQLTFEFVERQIRKKTFGILSTVSAGGRAQSTGVLYGVSPPDAKLSIYILTNKIYRKTRNIRRNSSVSLVIPYPHYYLRFVPSSCISFQGKAKIVPFNNPEAQESFRKKRMLSSNLKTGGQMKSQAVFIKIKPDRRISCYGIGIGVMKLRKHSESGSYPVTIPSKRV